MLNSKPLSLKSDDEILSFLEEYCSFSKNRAYILTALARPKENKSLTHNSAAMFREIITNKGAIRTKYSQLKTLSENYIPKEDTDKLTFRFYLTANARDINESFYLYKKKLIELQHHADNGHEESWNKIKRLDKEWKSMLQKEGNKEDSYFIIDIDKSSLDTFESIYMGLQEETDIITSKGLFYLLPILPSLFRRFQALSGAADDALRDTCPGSHLGDVRGHLHPGTGQVARIFLLPCFLTVSERQPLPPPSHILIWLLPY